MREGLLRLCLESGNCLETTSLSAAGLNFESGSLCRTIACQAISFVEPLHLLCLSVQIIFSSRPLNVASGTWWFTALASICGAMMMFQFFSLEYEGQNLLMSLVTGGGWTAYNKRGVGEQTFMLEVRDGRNCSMREGGLAMPGFGLVERPESMVSRCKRRKPPTLAWDLLSSDCSRLTLTYEEGHAPDSIFGFFVVHSPNTSAALVAGREVEYTFGQKVDGKWETYPFGMQPRKFRDPSTSSTMVGSHAHTPC